MEFNHNFTVSEADVFVLIVFDFDTMSVISDLFTDA